MFRYFIMAAAVITLCALDRANAADVFTPTQHDAIVAILRDALKRDPSILRDALEALQADEANRHEDAASAAIAANQAALNDPADPVGGNPNGRVTIVTFFDPRCPYCRQVEPMLQSWLQHDGDIKLVYKDLPILGAPSLLGSRALLAAQKQGGYERLRNAMMKDSPDISDDMIRDEAERVGLNWPQLRRDMDDPAIQARLQANVELARRLDIEGTPAFVVGSRLIVGSELIQVQQAVAAARTDAAPAADQAKPRP